MRLIRLAALLSLATAGCGADQPTGLDDTPPSDPAQPTAPVPPSDFGGDDPRDRAPTPSRPSGFLWQSAPSAAESGVQIFSASAPPGRVTASLKTLSPSLDGSWFAYTKSDLQNGTTEIGVIDTASLEPAYVVTSAGFVSNTASPIERNIVLAFIRSRPNAELLSVEVFDLEAQKSIKVITTGGFLEFLPDGRYLSISAGGVILAGSVHDELPPTQLGRMSLPLGASVAGYSVNGAGTRLAVRLIQAGATAASDLWLADLDGSNLVRFTKTTRTSYGVWSPDGTQIAFDEDPELSCRSWTCLHSTCQILSGPATAHDLTSSSQEVRPLGVQAAGGQTTRLPCSLRAWTSGPLP